MEVSETYQRLRVAIKERKLVHGIYKEHERYLAPHAIGHSIGVERMVAFQYAGGSSKGLISPSDKDNWRSINIADFKILDIVEGPWHTGNNHSCPQKFIFEVDLDVTMDEARAWEMKQSK